MVVCEYRNNRVKASVGKVGIGEVNDLTVLDGTVNAAARFQNEAKADQTVVSEGVFSSVADRFLEVPAETIEESIVKKDLACAS